MPKKIKIFLSIYISFILSLFSTLAINTNLNQLQDYPLSYTNLEDIEKECIAIEITNKNINKLALVKIASKIKQNYCVIENSIVVILTIIKAPSQLYHPLRC
ncbi:MAG: hypothetical protein N2596_08610 [Syntrophorhabdaceae bacterium]|nr:hypothetical protein [Syntrophorhabdaceae bacterium]